MFLSVGLAEGAGALHALGGLVLVHGMDLSPGPEPTPPSLHDPHTASAPPIHPLTTLAPSTSETRCIFDGHCGSFAETMVTDQQVDIA